MDKQIKLLELEIEKLKLQLELTKLQNQEYHYIPYYPYYPNTIPCTPDWDGWKITCDGTSGTICANNDTITTE
jgi:hypothetical protein